MSPSGYRDCFPDSSLLEINLLLILIRQMAALIRCALAEVGTVPVLLVCYVFCLFSVSLRQFVKYCVM